MSAVHAGRLERWLGPAAVDNLVEASKDWYGPPIPVANVPGHVYAVRGGDFVGVIRGGYFASLADFADQRARRIQREWARRQVRTAHAGFASLADLISEGTIGGKRQTLPFSIAGATGIAGRHNATWPQGALPPIGAAGGATGTGAACGKATTGALQYKEAGADQLHITTITVATNISSQVLLLYDRLWHMTHTMTVDPRTVDTANPPTRYQTTALAPGNFISGHVTTILPAAAPTIAFTYVDQIGNTAEAGPVLSTIATGAAVATVPFSAGPWFYPINSGDTGVRSITNVDLSAAMASGVVTWFIGHPLAFVPIGAANVPVILDGINSAFNLQRIFDDACLSFMELAKGFGTGTNWWGTIECVAG